MRTVVGVDLDRSESGPLRFARAISDATGTVICAVVNPGVSALLGAAKLEQPAKDLARSALLNRLLEVDPDANVDHAVVVEAGDAAAALAETAAAEKVDVIVMGRRAPLEGAQFVRLGAVARRLLRRVPTPLAIVPPDAVAVGEGPVILAVDGDDRSLGAYWFAHELARELEREVLMVTATNIPQGWVAGLVGAQPVQLYVDDLRSGARSSAEEWLSSHALKGGPVRVEMGPAADKLRDVANDVDAVAVVCGTRRLSAAQRIFSGSVGTELAASSKVPTIVVPPEWGPRDE